MFYIWESDVLIIFENSETVGTIFELLKFQNFAFWNVDTLIFRKHEKSKTRTGKRLIVVQKDLQQLGSEFHIDQNMKRKFGEPKHFSNFK